MALVLLPFGFLALAFLALFFTDLLNAPQLNPLTVAMMAPYRRQREDGWRQPLPPQPSVSVVVIILPARAVRPQTRRVDPVRVACGGNGRRVKLAAVPSGLE